MNVSLRAIFQMLALLTTCISSHLACAQQGIRQVDFRNFTYPLRGTLFGHSNLQWLSPSEGHSARPSIHLHQGVDWTVIEGERSGFKLVTIVYGDVDGDGQEDAVVDLHFLTGGTQQTDYVYVYTERRGMPELLAFCHTGDRAYSGLHTVYVERLKLVFELFDQKYAIGDCCSSGIVITRYTWRDGKFAIEDPVQRRVDPALIQPHSLFGDTGLR